MTKQILFFMLVVLVFSAHTSVKVGDTSSVTADPFETADVHFEQNATDGDVEVVFEVKGGDAGLLMLKVVGPDKRTAVDFKAPDASTQGIRSFRMESPEPKNIKSLKKAYPEGLYQFTATDSEGNEFTGQSTLSHELPEVATIVSPEDEDEGVPVKGARITWKAMEDIENFIVELEIESDGRNDNILATLPGTATSLAIPDQFLLPGMAYKISIGTVSEQGNISFVEITCTTEEK